MEKIVLIGGGGHCKACIDVIEAGGKYSIVGIVDIKDKVGSKIFGYEVIASDEDIPGLVKNYKNFIITIGQIKSPDKRVEKFSYIRRLDAEFPLVVSPYAYVSKHAFVGRGTIVMHRAVVNAGAVIGENCIINTGATIEHDVEIGSHCHISTGCVVNGNCSIGSKTFVGSNSVIANNIEVGEDVVIGAGAVVVNDIKEKDAYAGNPAEKIDG